MRLLMVAGLGPETRFARAAAGLALRGHQVRWSGPRPSSWSGPAASVSGWRDWGAATTDVVLGDGRSPARVALAASASRARAMVMPLASTIISRWGPVDRAAWHLHYAAGLVEPADAPAFETGGGVIAPERVGLWPDGEPSPRVDAAHLDTEILERACERALARQLGHVRRAALFVDRDGTLVREIGYLSAPEELELLPGVPGALRAAREAGLPVIVVSNQSGVGRGLFTLERVYQAMARLRELLRPHDVELDGIYLCPHRPEDDCPCRKPRTGLLERAAEDQWLTLAGSTMVGDKRIDAETGQNAGGHGVLVRTGYGRDEETVSAGVPTRSPDAVCDDLAAAVRWVLTHVAAED
ncbi:MAG: D-glycero-alpha-D-manno-heptose-1,7-bisphosphate 7-phosphatase [Candidatus Eisenbacteria bacterium]